MKKSLFIVPILLLLFGCNKENDIGESTIAGKFALNRVQTLKLAGSDTISTFFDLDSIKASKSFYFNLYNTGQQEITDISISTDNENFIISPSFIKSLPGKDSSFISRIISLDVIHGVRLNGVGYGKLLGKGDNTCKIFISGKTFNGSENIDVILEVEVKVYAKLMDISLYDGTDEVDLKELNRTFSISRNGLFTMTYFIYKEKEVSLKNTGNVSINMNLVHETFGSDVDFKILQTILIHPEDSVNLELLRSDTIHTVSFLTLDAQGTICNQEKILMGSDGSAYLGLAYDNGEQ